ncbi:MAG: hypothetical protein AB1508_12680 [Pseudomonadota bacterium]
MTEQTFKKLEQSVESVSALVNAQLDEHPEVRLVLQIVEQARSLAAPSIPVELDMASDWTVTPTVSQLPVL